MKYQNYHVFDKVVLQIDLECELARQKQYLRLLSKWGMVFANKPHPGTTPTFSQNDKRCFDAAYEVARDFKLLYCEGLMLVSGHDGQIPIGHGWCCDRSVSLVDPTMSKFQGDSRVYYFGVPIRKDYVQRWHDEVGYVGVLDGYPDGRDSPIYTDNPTLWLDSGHGYK